MVSVKAVSVKANVDYMFLITVACYGASRLNIQHFSECGNGIGLLLLGRV